MKSRSYFYLETGEEGVADLNIGQITTSLLRDLAVTAREHTHDPHFIWIPDLALQLEGVQD